MTHKHKRSKATVKAKKFTFRVGKKYPISECGKKVKWTADRDHALSRAKGFGATHFIELDGKGKILKEIKL